jgi:hypothetical protein
MSAHWGVDWRATGARPSLNPCRNHPEPATRRRWGRTLLASGFERATIRFEEACAKPHPEAALHALFEAVAWAGALRERLGRERREVYVELEALRFVRDLALHEGADALDWAVDVPGSELGTLVLGVSALGTDTTWAGTWRSVSSLPPNRQRGDRPGERQYEDHLVGRRIADTLNAVTQKLRADSIIHRDHLKQHGLGG